MRNDKLGKITHEPETGLATFYASGFKGAEVRADGCGGLLARGYYWRAGNTDLAGSGPFKSRKLAVADGFKAIRAIPLPYSILTEAGARSAILRQGYRVIHESGSSAVVRNGKGQTFTGVSFRDLSEFFRLHAIPA